MERDEFDEIVRECGGIIDDAVSILSDLESDLESEKENLLVPLTQAGLEDMAFEVADSARIKKAEAHFVKRQLLPDSA